MTNTENQATIRFEDKTFYSVKYIAEHIVTNKTPSALYAALKKAYEKPAVIMNGRNYWSIDQIAKVKESYQVLAKEAVSNDGKAFTIRNMAESSRVTIGKVRSYIKQCGFAPVYKRRIGGGLADFYDKGVAIAVINHFDKLEKPTTLKDQEIALKDQEIAKLQNRLADEERENKESSKSIANYRQQIAQLTEQLEKISGYAKYDGKLYSVKELGKILVDRDKNIAEKDRSISAYKSIVRGYGEKRKKTEERWKNKQFTVREMAFLINAKDNLTPEQVLTKVYGFIRSHHLKPCGNEGSAALYNEEVFNKIKDEFDVNVINIRMEAANKSWKRLGDYVGEAEKARTLLKDRDRVVSCLQQELNTKEEEVNKLTSEIEEYKEQLDKANEQSKGFMTRLKRAFV